MTARWSGGVTESAATRRGRKAHATPRRLTAVTMFAAALVAVSGCSVLGLESTGPVDATVTTSAAAVADANATGAAVTIPTLQTGTTSPVPTATPWQSLTSTETAPTTTTAPLTAPTTTRTLTFESLPEVTKPTIAAPTSIASPPPDCYRSGACPPQASATSPSGTLEVLNPSGGAFTIVVLASPGKPATAMSIARLTKPTAACTGSYCLVQGSRLGLYFGNVVKVAAGTLTSVPGTATSTTALHMLSSGAPVVGGSHRFDSYGVGPSDSPVAARTWGIAGGQLASTGCGEPYLYARPPAATAALRGPCSGTPRIAGYGPSSGNKLVTLGGFVTPSGNISCGLLPNNRLVCGAKNSSVSVPKCTQKDLVAGKDLTGLRVTMGTSGAVRKDDCIGYDLVGLPKTRISYQRLAVGRGFVCEVLQDGVTCTSPTGRGFTLSRASISTH